MAIYTLFPDEPRSRFTVDPAGQLLPRTLPHHTVGLRCYTVHSPRLVDLLLLPRLICSPHGYTFVTGRGYDSGHTVTLCPSYGLDVVAVLTGCYPDVGCSCYIAPLIPVAVTVCCHVTRGGFPTFGYLDPTPHTVTGVVDLRLWITLIPVTICYVIYVVTLLLRGCVPLLPTLPFVPVVTTLRSVALLRC